MSEKLPPILAAEDEESDRMILELAFKRVKLRCPLVIVRDGQEVVDYLSGKGRFADRELHSEIFFGHAIRHARRSVRPDHSKR